MRVLIKYLGQLSLIETDDIERDNDITRLAVRESDNDLTCDSIPIEDYNDRLKVGLIRGYINFSQYDFLLSYN